MRPNKLRLGGVAELSWAKHGAASARKSANAAKMRLMSGLNQQRCKSCQTLYQSPMKSLCATALALLLVLPCAQAKKRHCMFRLHTEANPRDTAAFSSSVPAKFSGKSIAIERMPRISEQDVTAFYPYSAADKAYGVLIQLNDHGRLALDTLSVERLGSLVFVFINGRPITELQIDKRISDGKIYIASGLSAADIALMKKDWRLIGQRKR